MEILRDFKQISDRVYKIFGVDVSNLPILDPMSKEDLKALVLPANINKDLTEVSSLAELIFQLNEYVPALCNLVKMFLFTNHYTAIVAFMEKLFVAHVGSANYVSKNQEYSHKERFFDRFIEVVKCTDLKLPDYLPFLFEIIEDNDRTELSNYLAPCLEYMQNLYRENSEDIKTFISSEPRLKNTYYTLGLEYNTQKAMAEIFNSENGADDALFAKILKHYYTDTMAFFDKNLENAGAKKFHYVKILASIENPEVTARLEDLYEEETNEEIKAFIKAKLGIADKSNLGCSPKHFETMAIKKVEEPQERTLGVPFEKMILKFNDGTEANNVVKTYLINIFKTEKDLLNLYGLSDVKTLFAEADLINFAQSLFMALKKLKDIKEAKWAIRLISLVCRDGLEDEIYDFVQGLYRAGRAKEAKYLLECLIYSKKERVVSLLSKLIEENNSIFINDKEYFVSLYSENMSRKMSDVQDMLVNDEITEQTLLTQKDRLYSNFIANKSYTKEQFTEMFINKKVFNVLAQKLVFGEYKQNRLLSLFVLNGCEINYIAKANTEADGVLKIKIAHSLDLDDRFEVAKTYFAEPTFVQFQNTTFVIKESEKTLTKVSSMQGILINALKFTSNMACYGFVRNIAREGDETSELVHVCPELNLLAEVSFEKPISNYSTIASIGHIRFYKLNQCLKNGGAFIINKANAVAVGGVEPRYYDYVVGAVSKSLKN